MLLFVTTANGSTPSGYVPEPHRARSGSLDVWCVSKRCVPDVPSCLLLRAFCHVRLPRRSLLLPRPHERVWSCRSNRCAFVTSSASRELVENNGLGRGSGASGLSWLILWLIATMPSSLVAVIHSLCGLEA